MSKMGLDGTLLNWPRYIEDSVGSRTRFIAGAAGGIGVTVISRKRISVIAGAAVHPSLDSDYWMPAFAATG